MTSESVELPYDFVTLEDIGSGGLGHSGTENIKAKNHRSELNDLDEVDELLLVLVQESVFPTIDKDVPTLNKAEIAPMPHGVESDAMFFDVLTFFLSMLLLGAAAYSAWLLFTAP